MIGVNGKELDAQKDHRSMGLIALQSCGSLQSFCIRMRWRYVVCTLLSLNQRANHFLCINEWFRLSKAASNALVFVQLNKKEVKKRRLRRTEKNREEPRRTEKSNRNKINYIERDRDK